MSGWPDGAWLVLVARCGALLVTERGAKLPRSDVFPVAAEASQQRARALCLVLGQPTDTGQLVVPNFPGTIGAAVELRQQLALRRPGAVAALTEAMLEDMVEAMTPGPG
jgi:hypothetical protein